MNLVSLSSIFKPYTDAIRDVLSGKYKTMSEVNSVLTDNNLIEELENDVIVIKSAFDNELLDIDEYIEQLQTVKNKISDLKKKQDYADAIIKNEKGEILLLRRAVSDSFCPDCWGLPGGKIEKNETPDQAVIREIAEETNLKIISTNILLKKKIKNGFIYYFECVVENIEGSIILDVNEHIEFSFVDKTKFMEMDLLLDLKDTLNDIIEVTESKYLLFEVSHLDHNTIDRNPFITGKMDNDISIISEKDFFMKDLFSKGEITDEEYIDYICKAHTDESKKVKLKSVDKKGSPQIKWVTKADLKTLAKHAKSTPQSNLENVIKDHPHPTIRQVAHAEIERREKEEKVPKPEDGYQGHEYHGREFKYNKEEDSYVDEEGVKANKTKLHEYHEMRHNEQKEALDKVTSDLDQSTKEKDVLHNRLVKEYYKKIIGSRFPTIKDQEEAYKISLVKLQKMGLKEEDIDQEKLKKILEKKFTKENLVN